MNMLLEREELKRINYTPVKPLKVLSAKVKFKAKKLIPYHCQMRIKIS